MTASKPQPPRPHQAALLLPWYAGGTLADGERLVVEAHLSECAECRAELESIVELRKSTRAMFAGAPAPSSRLHTEVMARVRASPQNAATGRAPRRDASRPPLLQSFAAALQRLMRPSWVPALAALVIVVQGGVLGWLVLQESSAPQVQSRGVETSATRIRIVFNPQATAQDIRDALTALEGRIVDGPTPDGAYVIELPALEPTVLSQRLRELRARPGLVERIDNAAP